MRQYLVVFRLTSITAHKAEWENRKFCYSMLSFFFLTIRKEMQSLRREMTKTVAHITV